MTMSITMVFMSLLFNRSVSTVTLAVDIFRRFLQLVGEVVKHVHLFFQFIRD